MFLWCEFDFRYEFSETRKVLDEFFHKTENEVPAPVIPCDSASIKKESRLGGPEDSLLEQGKPGAQQEGNLSEFNDLNYTLRRFSPKGLIGSSAVGQRLAGTEEEIINSTLITHSMQFPLSYHHIQFSSGPLTDIIVTVWKVSLCRQDER